MLIWPDLVETDNRIEIRGVVNSEMLVGEVHFEFCCPHPRHCLAEFARGKEVRVRFIVDFFDFIQFLRYIFPMLESRFIQEFVHDVGVIYKAFRFRLWCIASGKTSAAVEGGETQPFSSMKSGQKTCSSSLAV